MKALTLFLLLALAACAGSETAASGPQQPDPRIASTLEGLKPGKPAQCIPRSRVREIRTAKDIILYVEGRNRVWRNDLVGGCAGLRRDDIVVWQGWGSDYCRGDMIRTQDRAAGQITGACALGDFTPYTR